MSSRLIRVSPRFYDKARKVRERSFAAGGRIPSFTEITDNIADALDELEIDIFKGRKR